MSILVFKTNVLPVTAPIVFDPVGLAAPALTNTTLSDCKFPWRGLVTITLD